MTAGILAMVALAAGACGASDAERRAARTSGYRGDFAVVYSEALAATRDLYPNLAEDARTGIVRTAWHPVRIGAGNAEDATTQGTGSGVGGPSGAGLQTTNASRTMYFVRFAVFVVGGRPWRIRVEGEASSWRAGEVPTPLRGADVPPWLRPREDALIVAIHRRLHAIAVPLRYSSSEAPPPPPKVDVRKHHGLPAAAAVVVARTESAALARDVTTLRRQMADAFTWDLGSEPSAEVAIAMWQADPTVLAELAAVIGAGCRGVPAAAASQIVCPSRPAPDASGRRARFALIARQWRLVAFVAPE